MARLEVNEKGRLYIRIPRGRGFSSHRLNTYGEERVKQKRLNVGGRVPYFVLQLLDQHLECQPLCGAFKGQLEFDQGDFQRIIMSPHASALKTTKKTQSSVYVLQSQLGLFRYPTDPSNPHRLAA